MMANLTRPPVRSSTDRRARLTKSPAADDVENKPQHHAAVSTRRSSRAAPLISRIDEKLAKSTSQHPPKPAALARSTSRKRSAATALLSDATPETRPPIKVTVTQPHGDLVRITNGVSAILAIAEDEVPSGHSTPTTNGAVTAVTALAVPVQSTAAQTQDKRSLRSHDGGSRLKSDLAIYFSNYDDVIAGVPQSQEFLNLDTPIYIVDEPLKTINAPTPISPESSRKSASPNRARKSRALTPHRKASIVSIPPTQSSTTFQVLDYSSIARHLRNDHGEDPLADSVFFTQHRRAERKEKQLRNIEKERAMHEKVQLERLLDGLQGPDWLKVMGITGVTDGERKDWEPKRDYFVREVEALVDKFRIWKEEEKRLRAEKEAALAAREEDEDDEEESSESDVANAMGAEPVASEQREKVPKPPQPRRPPRPHGYVLPLPPPEPLPPFTSFYAKPHLRAAAMGKHRHGRNATAFGRPIPEFMAHEFEPPEELLTVEALRDHARKRRRQKRESGVKT